MTDDPEHVASCDKDKDAPAASQADSAQRALAMKQDDASTTHPENTATPDEGSTQRREKITRHRERSTPKGSNPSSSVRGKYGR